MTSKYHFNSPFGKTIWEEDTQIDFEKERLELKKYYPAFPNPLFGQSSLENLKTENLIKEKHKTIAIQTESNKINSVINPPNWVTKNYDKKKEKKSKKSAVYSILTVQSIIIIILFSFIIFSIYFYRYKTRVITIVEPYWRYISYDYSGNHLNN